MSDTPLSEFCTMMETALKAILSAPTPEDRAAAERHMADLIRQLHRPSMQRYDWARRAARDEDE